MHDVDRVRDEPWRLARKLPQLYKSCFLPSIAASCRFFLTPQFRILYTIELLTVLPLTGHQGPQSLSPPLYKHIAYPKLHKMVFVHLQNAHGRHHYRHLPHWQGHTHHHSDNETLQGPVKRLQTFNDPLTARGGGTAYHPVKALFVIIAVTLGFVAVLLTFIVIQQWLRRRRERRLEAFYTLPR